MFDHYIGIQVEERRRLDIITCLMHVLLRARAHHLAQARGWRVVLEGISLVLAEG